MPREVSLCHIGTQLKSQVTAFGLVSREIENTAIAAWVPLCSPSERTIMLYSKNTTLGPLQCLPLMSLGNIVASVAFCPL